MDRSSYHLLLGLGLPAMLLKQWLHGNGYFDRLDGNEGWLGYDVALMLTA